jgi:hypothetical protein
MSNCEHHVTAKHCKLCNTQVIHMAKDWKAEAIRKHYRIITTKIGDVVRFVAFKGTEQVGKFDLLPGADKPKSKGTLAHLGNVHRQF